MRLAVLPGAGALATSAGVSVLGFAAPWVPAPLLVQLAVAFLVGVAATDLVLLARSPRVTGTRRVAGSLALGVPASVQLELRSAGNTPLVVRCHDHHPGSFRCEAFPLRIALAGRAVVRYQATPTRRGAHRFGDVQLRVRSPLAFWWRDERLAPAGDSAQPVRVYPNFAPVAKYIALGSDERLSRVGVRRRRRRGEGSEFHQLRDYRRGDSMRQVDWRATARTRRLISREYQDERDQRVVFMLDCGLRMRERDDTIGHFDAALNAVLLLAYMALRQGDSVSIGTFARSSGAGPRWMGPVKGTSTVSRVLNALYDLEPSAAMPDYAAAAVELLARHRKHSLVVIVTNLRGEDSADLQPALRLLAARHRVLVASLRERALDLAMDAEVDTLGAALRVAAAHAYAEERLATLGRLRRGGILSLDVSPQALSAELVNAYLSIKSSRSL